MADPLQTYRRKRDFARTAEPSGLRPAKASAAGPTFVVQEHHARRLHYDFRLELDGVLKSWAVPQGPSEAPGERRLAVQVEDHPLDYASFEGEIPKGEYGGGTVSIWDRGTWTPVGDARAGLAAGKLKFELRGGRLRGRWTLVRMRGKGDERQPPWLLIREKGDAPASPPDDEGVRDARSGPARERPTSGGRAAPRGAGAVAGAGGGAGAPSARAASRASSRRAAAALPDALSPQLATLVDAAPDEPGWTWEMKFDGYRLLARIDGPEVRLLTRNGVDWTARVPHLVDAVRALGVSSGWLDGEIVVLGPDGAPDFQRLQNAFEASRTGSIRYFLFDAPFLDGEDLRARPLSERRERLRAAMDGAPETLSFSEDFEVDPGELLASACRLRMEGLIGKRADAPYESRRAPSWIKLKCTQRQEFVVGGFTELRNGREGLGALLLGVHDARGALRYAGNVGTGFDLETRRALKRELLRERVAASPFADAPRNLQATWVSPVRVAEVSFAEWTRDGRVRYPSFHALRDDKPASAIVREQPVPSAKLPRGAAVGEATAARGRGAGSAPEGGGARTAVSRASATAARRRAAVAAEVGGQRISHPERVVDPSTGITKLEVARHYATVAAAMLPHLRGRPVSVMRAPDGIDGERFFQKHAPATSIPGAVLLDAALDPGHAPLIAIVDRAGLIGAAQMNVIELHTWNARVDAIETPDRIVFDLDPGEGVPWSRMQEAARLVRAVLDELELESWLKTSGGKGLHVVVPIARGPSWAAARGVSKGVVLHLARTLPDRFAAKSGDANRRGRIFVDYLRNGRGATTVAAWSLRARPGMGVSVPVAWDELDALESGAHWTLRDVEARLEVDDPWAGMARRRQRLDVAMRALDDVGALPEEAHG